MQKNRTEEEKKVALAGSDNLAECAADLVGEAFVRYHAEFKAITGCAKKRFEECDWHGLHHDAEERLDLYGVYVGEVVSALRTLLGESARDLILLAGTKGAYTRLIRERNDFDIAQS